jgi:PAS domain S-box-containing protein
MTPRDVTVEELLGLVARMTAHEPHARCPEGSGPLGPLAAALNRLSTELSSAQPQVEDIFSAQTLLAQSPNIMFTCDTEARIRFINRTVPGLTPAEVMGTSLPDWFTPESAEKTRSCAQRVLSTGMSEMFEGQTLEVIGSCWYMGLLAPLQVNGRIVGFSMILTDVTELKQTQARLERSNQELESFAYVASHDLQEPLRKIQAFGERLKSTCTSTLSPEGRDYIERMQQAATRMRRLIDDLLSFSRISSKARPFVPVDLGAVAREVLGDLQTSIGSAGARVSLGELPVLEADPSQLRRLLRNLLGNALKFRRQDVPLEISVRATVDPLAQQCELVVEDNGIGFEEQYAERIFEVFQRLHGRGQYEGTGIGLAICRKIVERHGGRIGAHSTPGQGSSFQVTLPLKPLTVL